MKQAYLISHGLEEFAAAREQFSDLVNELQQDFVEFYEKRQSEGLEETSDPLIMSEDG